MTAVPIVVALMPAVTVVMAPAVVVVSLVMVIVAPLVMGLAAMTVVVVAVVIASAGNRNSGDEGEHCEHFGKHGGSSLGAFLPPTGAIFPASAGRAAGPHRDSTHTYAPPLPPCKFSSAPPAPPPVRSDIIHPRGLFRGRVESA